jgi:tyrosine-protein phosphatase YwqE
LQLPEQTIEFVKKMQLLGYVKLICTPHILSGVHPNSPATILPRLQDVKKILTDNNIDIKIEAAAEYMIDNEFAALAKNGDEVLSFGNNYVLIEMSYVAASPYLEESIFNLKLRNFQPILAHPERYSYLHTNFNKYIDIKDRGCLLQLNLLSLTDYYGKDVKKIAKKLLEEDMIDFVGTDMHHYNHLNATIDFSANTKVYQLLQSRNFLNATLV